MIRLEKLRREKGLSQLRVWELSRVDPAAISKAEKRGLRLTDKQAEAVAGVLGWDGDPQALFEDVN